MKTTIDPNLIGPPVLPGPLEKTDPEIVSLVREAIVRITTVPAETIEITAHEGWVVLEGTVNNSMQREVIEHVARHSEGVHGVVDLITVDSKKIPLKRSLQEEDDAVLTSIIVVVVLFSLTAVAGYMLWKKMGW